MTKRISDRDMLARTMDLLEGRCCDFFACPGPDARPVAMASCARATAAYELREYLRRHGGWCREHGQHLELCHSSPTTEYGYNPEHDSRSGGICHCRPVTRTPSTR
jgi:hypothetical protein